MNQPRSIRPLVPTAPSSENIGPQSPNASSDQKGIKTHRESHQLQLPNMQPDQKATTTTTTTVITTFLINYSWRNCFICCWTGYKKIKDQQNEFKEKYNNSPITPTSCVMWSSAPESNPKIINQIKSNRVNGGAAGRWRARVENSTSPNL